MLADQSLLEVGEQGQVTGNGLGPVRVGSAPTMTSYVTSNVTLNSVRPRFPNWL